MLDKILENLDDVAGQLGLPADQVKAMVDSFQAKVGDGGDQMSALMETAQEYGLSLDKLQDMLGGIGGKGSILGQVGDMLGDGKGGTDGALGGLAGMAKGLFGKG